MIKFSSVDLGVIRIEIPVAEILGEESGKSLLITAGSDGDEYASIDAAYQIIDEFGKKDFGGKLIVIPILNIPGFENVTSHNPLDNKYPKNIFPGDKNGSPCERLINWLVENYIRQTDIWIDLHGGAITEVLDPYIYLYGTKNPKVNELTNLIIKKINSPKIVYQKPGSWKKAEEIAKLGVAYMITEAGFWGDRSRVWIEQHIKWTKEVMGSLGMIDYSFKRKFKPRIYRRSITYKTKYSGLWFPNKESGLVNKGQMLGEVRSYSNKTLETIFIREEGELLWIKKGLFCKRKELIGEVAFQRLN